MVGREGRTWLDIEANSIEPLRVNQLRRRGRILSSGEIEVQHKIVNVTVDKVYEDLRWEDESCCYPTSGTINGEYSGEREGSFEVSIQNTCGDVIVTINGEEQEHQLSYCE